VLGPDETAERLQRLVPREYAERLLATRGQVTAERRMVTILFSDVKGSTALAEDLDPEEVLEIMDGAFDVLIKPIYRYEGTLARLMGDGVLAFFGAPIAHEDDPERACRAALDIIEGARAYAARLEQERGITGFNVRVGINTGLVVVGEIGSDLRVEYTAMGDAVNLAARMESAAEPGTVLISEATHKLIASLFETEALGPIQVKGKAKPVPVFRVLAAKEVPGKVRGIPGLESPLVGREAELAALGEALERLQAGVGGIVTIVGEAGIGKSRLVAEVRRAVASDSPRCHPERSEGSRVGSAEILRSAQNDKPAQWVEGRCLSYGTSIAYLLWVDVLRNLLGLAPGDSPETQGDALREQVQSLCPNRFDDVYPYLARLMSLPLAHQEQSRLDDLDGQRLKDRTFKAVETLIECVARQQPLALVCEDLHWADPTSLDLLQRLLALSQRAPVLFICAFRPVQAHGSWRLREVTAQAYASRYTELLLDRLSPMEAQTLVVRLLRVEDLPSVLRERILSRAEGNPFYVEEVIRSLIDRGAIVHDGASDRWTATGEVGEIPIPDTLQGVLMARIDRLEDDARRVLQVAAVIGRIFLYRVLAAITGQEPRLETRLLTLQQEEMIRQRARLPELEYIFKHELTREAAYNGLLKKARRAIHRQVADALEQLFPDRVDERLGLLAYHWEQAQDAHKALQYLLRAGDQARLAYAQQEAIDYYQRARSSLKRTDEGSPEAYLAIEEGLGDVRAVLAEHDVALAHYERARALLGAAPASSERLAGLCRKTAMLYERKGQYETAFQWLERGLGALGDSVTLEWGRIRLAGAGLHSRQGQHHEALQWCQSGLDMARQLGGRKELAHGTYLLGTIHGHLGHSAEEIACARQSLALYEEIGDLVGQCSALNNLGIACKESGDWAAAIGHFQRALDLEERLGDAHGTATVTNNLGNVLLQQGNLDAAARAYQKSLDLWETIHFPVGVALSWSNLGKVCVERGEWQQALDYLHRSHARFEEIQSQHFLPEVYRRMATAHLGLQQWDEARRLAQESVALADELAMQLEKGISLRVLGQVRLSLKEWEQAEQALTASLAIMEEQGNRYRMAETLRHLGRLYLAMAHAGDPAARSKAEPALQRARAIFEELGAVWDLAKVEEVTA
jgi:class 3 adenylate cyclase/tetratricopeptide (TPR) repeat protein